MKAADASFQSSTFYFRCQPDLDWQMNTITGNCEAIIESPAQELISNRLTFGMLILPEEEKRICIQLENALKNKMPYQLIYRIKTPKNNEKLLLEQGIGLYADSKVQELTGFISDITAHSDYFLSEAEDYSIHDCIKEVVTLAYQLKLTSNKNTIITDREIEVTIYFCQGLSMKEIGLKLHLSPRTVESYLYHIKLKLGCATKLQLRNLFLGTKSGNYLIKA
ncbi:MAG: LuxR C-terminal-related transcriptional regulator [Gammaproteobacteria bacterium]